MLDIGLLLKEEKRPYWLNTDAREERLPGSNWAYLQMSEHEAEKGMISRNTAAECDCKRLRHHVREQQMLIQLLDLK